MTRQKIKLFFKKAICLIGIIMAIFWSGSLYKITLSLNSNDLFMYYFNGAFWLKKNGVIDQYRNRPGDYSQAYLTSFFQPQVGLNGKVTTLYRRQGEKIEINKKIYYYYLFEDGLILTDKIEDNFLYKNNMIVSQRNNFYAADSLIANSIYEQLYNQFINKTIKIKLQCGRKVYENCTNVIDSFETKVSLDNTSKDPSFYFKNSFEFNQLAADISKTGYSIFSVPDNFDICYLGACQETTTKKFVQQKDFPVWIIENKVETKIKLSELNLSDFQKSSMFLSDFLSQDQNDPIPLPKNSFYLLKDKYTDAAIKITPQDDYEVSYLPKYRSIRFGKPNCNSLCETSFAISLTK